jgi:hypothetical protein
MDALGKVAEELRERLAAVQEELEQLTDERARIQGALAALTLNAPVRTPIASAVVDPELTPVQLRILTVLRGHKGAGMTIPQISNALNYDPPARALYRQILRLLELGLVQPGLPAHRDGAGRQVAGGIRTYLAVPRG